MSSGRTSEDYVEVGTTPLLGEEGTRHSTGHISLLGRGHTSTKHHHVPHRLCREAGGKQDRYEKDCFQFHPRTGCAPGQVAPRGSLAAPRRARAGEWGADPAAWWPGPGRSQPDTATIGSVGPRCAPRGPPGRCCARYIDPGDGGTASAERRLRGAGTTRDASFPPGRGLATHARVGDPSRGEGGEELCQGTAVDRRRRCGGGDDGDSSRVGGGKTTKWCKSPRLSLTRSGVQRGPR